MTWSWNKLSAAKWEDAWSERIAGNPNAVITKIKGGKTVRITVYCDDEEDALALKNILEELSGKSRRRIG